MAKQEKIQVGIVGYGNLGRGVEKALNLTDDMEVYGVFSRRNPNDLDTPSPAYHMDQLDDLKDKIDVLILCGGSQSDIPVQGPALAKAFNTVDAYDNHSQMNQYFGEMESSAQAGQKVSVIATGWDPGLFSMNRLLLESVLPQGQTYTFWGPGLSQGHSDAVRRVDGVKFAAQYTVPKEEILEKIRAGEKISYQAQSAHQRDVYLVLEDGADPVKVEEEIVNMPAYFKGYTTAVNFISEEDYMANHQGMPHGGRVLRQGSTSPHTLSMAEFSLSLGSNPEFTASVTLAYARACARLAQEGNVGAYTVFDIPLSYLSPKSAEELRASIL